MSTDQFNTHAATATAHVMQRATFAAVELGNFPLHPCDVQCAYECWLADRPTKAFTPEYNERIIVQVRVNLERLGFRF